MEATKQTKMTKEDLHLSWKDKLNIIRDNRYFLMLFPIVMLAVIILIFGVATAGRSSSARSPARRRCRA